MQLKDIRQAKKMTQEEVANALGIPKKTYQNYEREVREADSAILCQLTDLWHVSVDDLMGRTTFEDADEEELIRLFRMLDKRGRHKLIELADDMMMSGKYTKKKCKIIQFSKLQAHRR